MITLVLIFGILLLFPVSVYLFSKAEQESSFNRKQASHGFLTDKPVFISTVQQGKVQETWCYLNDFRSRLKHAKVSLENSPENLDHFIRR